MAGFCEDEYGCFGSMEVDGFPMNCPGWDLYGFQQLWSEFSVRTDDVILPTAPGRRSYPGRLDQTEYEMTLYVTGEADQNGVAHPDVWEGLYENLQTILNNAILPVGTGRGTRPATLTFPWGGTSTVDVKFDQLRQTDDIEDPRFAVYRTTLIVPAGRFPVATGS